MGLAGWNAQFFEYAQSLFHRGARNCGEDAVTRECGAECCPISVMKLLPVTIRIELVATVWQHRTSVSELHKS